MNVKTWSSSLFVGIRLCDRTPLPFLFLSSFPIPTKENRVVLFVARMTRFTALKRVICKDGTIPPIKLLKIHIARNTDHSSQTATRNPPDNINQ